MGTIELGIEVRTNMVIPPGIGMESDKEFGLKLYVENLVLGGSLVSCEQATCTPVDNNSLRSLKLAPMPRQFH